MQQDTIYVPLAFEHLMSQLFGQNSYHGFVGRHKLNDWKKHTIKLLEALRRAIVLNVATDDDLHRKELIEVCRWAIDGIHAVKTTDEANLTLIGGLVRILFGLLGEIPDHWSYKSTSRNEIWKLDKYRTLVYRQSLSQKRTLICMLPEKSNYRKRLPEARDLWSKWAIDFKKNDYDFINWFKQNYCEVYSEVF